jgi:hypothetical protein
VITDLSTEWLMRKGTKERLNYFCIHVARIDYPACITLIFFRPLNMAEKPRSECEYAESAWTIVHVYVAHHSCSICENRSVRTRKPKKEKYFRRVNGNPEKLHCHAYCVRYDRMTIPSARIFRSDPFPEHFRRE